MSLVLHWVQTEADVRHALANFQLAKGSHPRTQSLLRQTTYWVYDPQQDAFGPGKFVGFCEMTLPRYEQVFTRGATGNDFNGHATRKAIEKVTGQKFRLAPGLSRQLRDWAQQLTGEDPFTEVDISKWRFLVLPEDSTRTRTQKERMPSFVVGQTYHRRQNIHTPFGGQQQGGISTPGEGPFIFLFTGESGEQYGYQDGWDRNGVFLYTGEGQLGDMQFKKGNKAIRDHGQNGKELLVFQLLGKGKGYRYLGPFACGSWEYQQGPDAQRKLRRVIVFHLFSTAASVETDEAGKLETVPNALSLAELRGRAYAAGATTPEEEPIQETKRRYFQRSAVVKAYVLARAKGVCEACQQLAPFVRPDGTPYLEPHHIRRRSDGGPDHPCWVAAICPNCHREIHHGRDGEQRNRALEEYIQQKEPHTRTRSAKQG